MKKITYILFLFGIMLSNAVYAQNVQPKHTFRFIIPASPGTVAAIYLDIYNKCFAENNIEVLREYKPGGEFRVGFNDWMSRKDSDNLTNLYLGFSITNFFANWDDVNFEKDVDIISYLGTYPYVIVGNAEKNYSFNDLREISKNRPVVIGVSNPMDLYILDKISQRLNIKFQIINYKTTPVAHADLLGNHIDLWMGAYPSQKALVESKRLNIVASTETEETTQKNGYDSLLKISPDLANIPVGLIISIKPTVTKQTKDLLTLTVNLCNQDKHVINELAKYNGKPLGMSNVKIKQLIKTVRDNK